MRVKQWQTTDWSAWLSAAALGMLAALSFYGLSQNYRLEKGRLRREVELVVREVSMQQQARFFWRDASATRRVAFSGMAEGADTARTGNTLIIRRSTGRGDTATAMPNFRLFRDARNPDRNQPPSLTGPILVYVIMLPWDSMPMQAYEPLFSAALSKAGLPHHFTLQQEQDTASNFQGMISLQGTGTKSGSDSIAFQGQPRRIALSFETPIWLILGRMVWPITLAVGMLAITALAFYTNRRGLLAQQRLLVAKNDLISNIGHELKTPVATVSLALEALDRMQAAGQQQKMQEYLSMGRAEIQRLGMLVEKVLQQAMLEEGKLQVQNLPINLAPLVQQVCAGMQPAFDKVQGRLQVAAADAMVLADEVHVASLLYNLLDNAIKYRSNRPLVVAVRVVSNQDGGVLLEVSDNGFGIAAPYRQKVFERFFRVPTPGDHSVKGHGLGLSYVHQVVEAMGGTIVADVHPDGGSIFRVTFRSVV